MLHKDLTHYRRTRDQQASSSPLRHHKISKVFPVSKLKNKKSPKRSPKSPKKTTDLEVFSGESLFGDLFKETFTPFKELIETFDPFTESVNAIEKVFDGISEPSEMSDTSHDLEEEFESVEDMIENPPELEDPEHTSYFVKYVSNDNGRVKVKSLQKVPGSDWEKYTEEYTAPEGKKMLKGKKNKAIKDRDAVEIVEEAF